MKKIFLAFLLISSAALAQPPTTYDSIQASGEGEVKVKPDFVMLSTTVYSRGPSAQQAQKENAKEMSRIDKILKQDFKIEAKDLQTESFQVSPQYEYVKERSVYKGMAVNHTLLVKLRKVDEVGNLLDKLTSGQSQEGFGVRIDDISFGTDQMKSYQAQALEQAMIDAKSRAQILAKAGSRTLGIVRKISDTRVSSSVAHPFRGLNKATFSSMAEDAVPTQISAGEITVRAQIEVEFDVK